MMLSAEVTRNARPYLHGPEYEAAHQALRAGQYGHSEITDRFEDAIARYLGSRTWWRSPPARPHSSSRCWPPASDPRMR